MLADVPSRARRLSDSRLAPWTMSPLGESSHTAGPRIVASDPRVPEHAVVDVFECPDHSVERVVPAYHFTRTRSRIRGQGSIVHEAANPVRQGGVISNRDGDT